MLASARSLLLIFGVTGDNRASICSAPIWRANVEGKRTLRVGSVGAGGLLNEGYL